MTGCRRGEIVNLKWSEIDLEGSCLRLIDSKEGSSVRPVGLPVVEHLETQRPQRSGTYVFPGQGVDNAVGNFPQSWKKLFKDTQLWDVTPHVRSEEHTSELQSLMRISYAVFCLKKKNNRSSITTLIKTA